MDASQPGTRAVDETEVFMAEITSASAATAVGRSTNTTPTTGHANDEQALSEALADIQLEGIEAESRGAALSEGERQAAAASTEVGVAAGCMGTAATDRLELVGEDERRSNSVDDQGLPLDNLGFSAYFLRDFLREHGDAVKDLTTEEVCNSLVKPFTLGTRDTFLNWRCMPHDDGADSTGKATVFVSHAWKYRFSKVAEVMLAYAEENPATFFWLDIFCHNQHGTPLQTFEWWSVSFQKIIRSIGAVLLILSPWHRPIPLTRAWCLWEIYCALNSGVRLSICLPIEERAALLKNVTQSQSAVLDALIAIDAERSEAREPHDLYNIHKAIQESGLGFHRLNLAVKTHLREWFMTTAQGLGNEIAKVKSDLTVQSLVNLASSLDTFGCHYRAIEILQRALDTCTSEKGQKHADTANVWCRMATMYTKACEFSKALKLYQQALHIQQETLDEQHVDIAASCNSIAEIYLAQKKRSQALEWHNRALHIYQQRLGEECSEVATTYGKVAAVLTAQGQYNQALETLERALKILLGTVGEQHLDAAVIYTEIAEVHSAQHQNGKATEQFERALKIFSAKMGDKHPETATILNRLVLLKAYNGRAFEAREHCQQARQIFMETLGKVHISTLSSDFVPGLLLQKKSDQSSSEWFDFVCSEKLAFYEQRLQTCMEMQGEQHADTAAAHHDMAAAHRCRGNFSQALQHYEQALQIRLALLGEQHLDTAESYASMASFFDSRSMNEKAMEYYQRALDILLARVGEEHPDTAAIYEDLARVAEKQANDHKALAFYEKILRFNLTKLGEQSFSTVNTRLSMAFIFRRLDLPDKALEHYGLALEARRALLGELHHEIATIYEEMATVYESLKYDNNRALEHSLRALNIYSEMQAPQMETPCTKVSLIYKSQGDHVKAQEFKDRALQIHNKKLNDSHPFVLKMAHSGMADIYVAHQEYGKALEHYELTLQISSNEPGQDHDIDSTLSKMAKLYEQQQDFAKAIIYYELSVETSKARWGNRDPTAAFRLQALAGICEKQGNYSKALEYCEEALKFVAAEPAEEFNSTKTNVLSSMARIYWLQPDYDKALECYDRILTSMFANEGQRSGWTVFALTQKAKLCMRSQHYGHALNFWRQLLEFYRANLGSHVGEASTYMQMAAVHSQQNGWAMALQCHEKALERCRAKFGDTDSMTADCTFNAASLYDTCGQHNRALELYQQALEIFLENPYEIFSFPVEVYHQSAFEHLTRGTYSLALNCFELANKELVTSPRLHRDRSFASGTISSTLSAYGGGVQQHIHAITKLGEENPAAATTLCKIALIHHGNGQPDQALRLFERVHTKLAKLNGTDTS